MSYPSFNDQPIYKQVQPQPQIFNKQQLQINKKKDTSNIVVPGYNPYDQKNEIYQQLYVQIKILNMVEKLHIFGKIDDNSHKNKAEQCLNAYKKFEKLAQKDYGYDLDNFIKDYNLSDCTRAIEFIKNPPEDKDKVDKIKLILRISNDFHKALDVLFFNQAEPKIAQFKDSIDDLMIDINKAIPAIGNQALQLFPQLEKFVNENIKGKNITDLLSESEYKALVDYLSVLQNQFEKHYSQNDK